MTKKWTTKDIPDLTNKVIIVTGANNGLGFENTKQFSDNGATVIMACRNLAKGQTALEKIKRKNASADIGLIELDLGNLESVHHFAAQFKENYDRLDVLLNNAGIMLVPYQKTVDGFESQVGTNHLGHFALTALLYDRLKTTSRARIVNVSSTGHTVGKMDWDDFLFEKKYSRMGAYSRSKLANLLFTYEMDRRFRANEVDIISVAAHPGGATTGLGDHLLGPIKFVLYPIARIFFFQSASAGSLPSTRASVDPHVKGGQYYGPRGLFGGQNRGPPTLVQSHQRSHRRDDAEKLWAVSEELTGVIFEI